MVNHGPPVLTRNQFSEQRIYGGFTNYAICKSDDQTIANETNNLDLPESLADPCGVLGQKHESCIYIIYVLGHFGPPGKQL